MSYKLEVFQTIDFEMLGDKSHKSISGGIATHSHGEVETRSFESLEILMGYLTIAYGTPYIFDDRLEIQVNDAESLSFYINKVTVEPVSVDKIKKLYPNLEEH